MSLDQLTELPDDIAERIGEVLNAFGYDPAVERLSHRAGSLTAPAVFRDGSLITSLFGAVNEQAMANLAAWVPALELKRYFCAGSGFKAVAEWRPSSTGRPLHLRKPNLSFKSNGIRDFGDGRGYTPVDVVMEARRMTSTEALEWLASRVGVKLIDSDAAAMADRIIASATEKRA